MADFSLVGQDAEHTFWWNDKSHNLRTLSAGELRTYNIPVISGLKKVIHYCDDTALLIAPDRVLSLSLATGSYRAKWFTGGIDGIVGDTNRVYLLSSYDGLYKPSTSDSRPERFILDNDRYNGAMYDQTRKLIWLYGRNNISIVKEGQLPVRITTDILQSLGIANIEKMMADSFGNVFIKTNASLLLVDIPRQALININPHNPIENTLVNLNGSTLVVAGAFGVIFQKILGPHRLSPGFLYANIKGAIYKVAEQLTVSAGCIYLKTNTGFYNLPVNETAKHSYSKEAFHLVVDINGQAHAADYGDTIAVGRQLEGIRFDCINPSGVGTAGYRFYDGNKPLNGDITDGYFPLNSITPGTNMALTAIIYDDIWESKPQLLYVYKEPYWWQTGWGKTSITIAAVALLLSLVYAIIYLTRKITSVAHMRRNAHLELELKAIHSQINPHFIFNTLGVAQYFISRNQLKDAGEHVRKFSSLLRSYLKSSRNKVISVAEEISNLKNYIELQQVRFQNKFSYDIHVSPTINTPQTLLPSLLLQPLVENAINHGLLPKKEAGWLKIEFQSDDPARNLLVIIEDNGIGRAEAAKRNVSHKESFGSDLIKTLVGIFNEYESMAITIDYHDKADNQGTTVTIRIRYKT